MPFSTSFVLRVWRVRHSRGWACRVLLEHVSSGERVGFADLSSLVAYLEAQLESAGRAQDVPSADDEGHETRASDDVD